MTLAIWHSVLRWYVICGHETRTRTTWTARSRLDSHPLGVGIGSFRRFASLSFSAWSANFGATHGIYRRTALKRCQRKGNRPRGGFRLPWARCRTNAWDGSARGSGPEFVRRSDRGFSTKHSQMLVAVVGGGPFHEFYPALPRAGVAHQHEPHASNQLRRPQPRPARCPPARRPLRRLCSHRCGPALVRPGSHPSRRLSPRRLL